MVEEPTPGPGLTSSWSRCGPRASTRSTAKIRKGLRATEPLTAPRGLGSDAAGVVVALGEDAEGFAVGDEVIVSGATDAYASHLLARVRQLTAKPAALSWEAAAGLGIPAGTAYQVLRSLQLTAGEMLLVHGGSGGVGRLRSSSHAPGAPTSWPRPVFPTTSACASSVRSPSSTVQACWSACPCCPRWIRRRPRRRRHRGGLRNVPRARCRPPAHRRHRGVERADELGSARGAGAVPAASRIG